jgi:hypothetical protein
MVVAADKLRIWYSRRTGGRRMGDLGMREGVGREHGPSPEAMMVPDGK